MRLSLVVKHVDLPFHYCEWQWW